MHLGSLFVGLCFLALAGACGYGMYDVVQGHSPTALYVVTLGILGIACVMATVIGAILVMASFFDEAPNEATKSDAELRRARTHSEPASADGGSGTNSSLDQRPSFL